MLQVIEIKKGQHIIKKGSKLTAIFWLIKGSVSLQTEHADVLLKGGNVLGIPDCLGNTYKYDYVAEEDGTVYAIPYKSPGDLKAIYSAQKNYAPVFLMAVMNTASQVAESINVQLSDMKELMSDPEFPNTPETFRQQFYLAYAKQSLGKIEAFFGENETLLTGEILTAAKYLTRAVPALDNLLHYRQNSEQMNPVEEIVPEEEYFEEDEEWVLPENPLAEILYYAGYDKYKSRDIADLLARFRALPDQNDTDDETRNLRRALTNVFYETYKAVFKKSIGMTSLPPVIILFLNFGFLDLDLCGKENAEGLLKLARKLDGITSRNVYTLPQWLLSIYGGKNDPSKNDFDMDFETYLRDEKKNGRMNDREVEMFKRDGWKKVEFEIDNMVKANGRATFGRVLTFCPVLSGDNLIRSVEQMILSATELEGAIAKIEETDYSLFYHDMMFSDPDYGINVENIKVRILPNIILLPNYGVRAMMWQETAGIRNNTPARFIFPILFDGDIEEQMLLTCGRYRWEYCRKVEGARWNDVMADSLTGKYCDYLQFYKKNRDLNQEAKEKLQKALFRVKNSFREVFVMDYVTWMKYETRGSMRLNRVTREMMFQFCPVSAVMAQSLASNPNFTQRLNRHQVQKDKDKKRLNSVIERYVAKGGTNTKPLMKMLEYYDL